MTGKRPGREVFHGSSPIRGAGSPVHGGWAERNGERFYRMWKYYLLSSAGGFRARVTQVWQSVLSKGGAPGGYLPVR